MELFIEEMNTKFIEGRIESRIKLSGTTRASPSFEPGTYYHSSLGRIEIVSMDIERSLSPLYTLGTKNPVSHNSEYKISLTALMKEITDPSDITINVIDSNNLLKVPELEAKVRRACDRDD